MINILNRLQCGILFLLVGATAGIAAEWEMPPTLISDSGSTYPHSMSEADDNGHVMLLGQTGINELNAYYYTNGAWTLSANLLTSPSIVASGFDVAMDPTGTALAIFIDEIDASVNTRYFNGTSWSTPTPAPLDTTGFIGFPDLAKVAMNGPGQGVAVWFSATDLVASFFSGGTWSVSQVIGPPATDISLLSANSVVYSANGTAAVAWFDSTDSTYYITNFDGAIWQPAQALGPSTESFRDMGIDANGDVYVAGNDSANGIIVVHFDANTSTVDPSQVINTSLASSGPSIAVAPGGTAVAIWHDQVNQGYSSAFNGVTWSAEFPFSPGGEESFIEDVSVDTSGNALAVWGLSDGSIRAAVLPLSGVWSNPSQLVSPNLTGSTTSILSALSAEGTEFASWGEQVGEFDILLYANASFIAPPTLQIQVCPDRSGSVLDCTYTLSWVPSADPEVDHYDIYRDAVFLVSVPAIDPPIYVDVGLCQATVVYSIQSVTVIGATSDLVSITVEPCCTGFF